MPHYTEQETRQIAEVRTCLDSIEKACKTSAWLPNGTGLKITDSISFLREHINVGRTDPSIDQIYTKLFAPHPFGMPGIEELIEYVSRAHPAAHPVVMDPTHQVPNLIAARIAWKDYEGRPTKPPINYRLPGVHPDYTDRFGYPVYVAIDKDGQVIEGRGKDSLSQLKTSKALREKNGTARGYRVSYFDSGMTQRIDYAPVPLPDITPDMRRAYEVELAKENPKEDRQEWATKQWLDIIVPYKLKHLRADLEAKKKKQKEQSGRSLIDIDDMVSRTEYALREKAPSIDRQKVRHELATMILNDDADSKRIVEALRTI